MAPWQSMRLMCARLVAAMDDQLALPHTPGLPYCSTRAHWPCKISPDYSRARRIPCPACRPGGPCRDPGCAGSLQMSYWGSESPAQLVILADPVVVEYDEREGVLRVAGHQQLELLVPHGVPRGVGDGALQLAVRAQVQPACSLSRCESKPRCAAASRSVLCIPSSHGRLVSAHVGVGRCSPSEPRAYTT